MHYLSIDEMIEAASASKLPGLEAHTARLETAADALACDLAAHLAISYEQDAELQLGFGGLLAGFGPPADNPDMSCPYVIASSDSSSDWVTNNGVGRFAR